MRLVMSLVAVALAGMPSATRARVNDRFVTTPFDATAPRWCERYHHGHWMSEGGIRFERSGAAASECEAGGPGTSLSCHEPGCDPCGHVGSPCAKIGDPLGNAVVQTATDDPGVRRSVTARFRIERQLPIGESHLALYAALHPHCHTTAQAILVPDRPGVFHLNVAAFNEFIGGDRRRQRVCLTEPMHEISPPLAVDLRLDEGVRYAWTLTAELDARGHLVAVSTVADQRGNVLGSGRYTFVSAPAVSWFGALGAAARYGFGAQLGAGAGDPAVMLLEFDGASR
jgi:hypothetical protein